MAVGGCRVVSLPPGSNRTDGGPVASRGVISHDARSELRLYRDAAGCESVQTVNRQFRLVTVVGPGGPGRRVLEESYDVRHCLASESSSSEAVITVWHPDSAGASGPLFQIRGRGASGSPVGNLYRLTVHGCCGSQNLASYSSLLTGRALFTASIPPVSLEVANRRIHRFAAFHDTFSATAPAEAEADSSVVGVLQWGDDQVRARRVVIRADRPEAFAIETLGWIEGGLALKDSALVLWPDRPARNLGLEIRLVAPGSGRRLRIRIPMVDLDLVVPNATVPPGVQLASER